MFNPLISVHSFVEVVRYLFSIPGVKFVLSGRFSQDPLEKYFGNQRQHGGSNENPNVQQMVHSASALRALKSVTLNSVRGNCGRSKAQKRPPLVVDNSTLPKKKRTSCLPSANTENSAPCHSRSPFGIA